MGQLSFAFPSMHPDPASLPKRVRGYVRLKDLLFRRETLSVGSQKETWQAIQPHSAVFEMSATEVLQIPAFTEQAEMDAYIERLMAFEDLKQKLNENRQQ